jgi:hypothetical protein
MENQIKNFFDYLFYIGVTSDETSSVIIQLLTSKYNDFKFESCGIDDLLISLICDYFKLLTEQQLMLIGKNIYEQFLRNKFITKIKHVKKLIIIKYHFIKRKIKKYFNKWRLKTINLTTTLNQNDNIKNYDISYSSSSYSSLNISNFLNKLDYYNEIKNKEINKLKDLSETNIMKNCTFIPNLNKRKKRNKRLLSENEVIKKRSRDLYNSLYDEYKYKIDAKKELTKKIYDNCGYTFSPKINKNDKYINNISSNFFERNQEMIEKKKKLLKIINSPKFFQESLKKSFTFKNLK